jgi:predicted Zn-dependent peptidase
LLVAISRPLFLDDEFKAEFGNVMEEMSSRANQHFRRLSLEMRQAFGLLVKTDTERLELMNNVQIDDVRSHYSRTHTTPNLRFVIAGNITKRRRSTIDKLFATIELPEQGARFDLPAERPKLLEQPVYVHNDTVENLYFYLDTFMNRRMSDSETDALNLANTMLTETLYSKILGTARERGLVYGMNSGLSQTRDASNWWFGAQVSDKNAPALFDIVVSELTKLLKGDISDEDIEATKQYALGRFQRSAQTVGGTAAGYSSRYFFDDVIEAYERIPERIKAVTKDDIVTIARQFFADKTWGFGVLGACGDDFAEKLRKQLAPLWEQVR